MKRQEIYWNPILEAHVIEAYDLIVQALSDSRLSAVSRHFSTVEEQELFQAAQQPVRKAVIKSYQSRLGWGEKQCMEICRQQFSPIEDLKSLDLVADLISPFCQHLAFALTEMPFEEKVLKAAKEVFHMNDSETAGVLAAEGTLFLSTYFSTNRQHAKDGFLAKLIQTASENWLSQAIQLFVGVSETLKFFLSNQCLFLLEDFNGQTVAEKMLESVCGPVQYVYRYAIEPITIQDITIPENGRIALALASANRAGNLNHPSVLNYAKHLSFGKGRHACLGMAIIRMASHVFLAQFFLYLKEKNLRLLSKKMGGTKEISGFDAILIELL